MDIKHLHLQYDRLSRHYEASLAQKDEISFLDLAHALRVWVDMKARVTTMAAERGLQLSLRHHTAPKSLKKSLKGATHTYIPLASGVESPGVQVKGLVITNRALTPDEIKQRASMGPPVAQVSQMSFAEWMAAGVLEVPSNDPSHPHVKISREIMIKRIANALGASHPVGMEEDDLSLPPKNESLAEQVNSSKEKTNDDEQGKASAVHARVQNGSGATSQGRSKHGGGGCDTGGG